MTPRAMLEALRAGPFRGYGGAAAIAAALGVSVLTVKLWRNTDREPSYQNRQKIEALYARHFGGDAQ